LDDIPFVKNIENVQGDERDIIIFSIGYAKDPGNPEGEVSMRFGTLNQEGGENRLNVAVTRARKEIIIVCSIDPDKLNIEKTKNEGPKRMKDYLSYAKAISEGRREDARQILMSLNNRFDDQNINVQDIKLGTVETFETVIQKELEKIGYQVDYRVGHSNYKIDLAVVHPDDLRKYILTIETDGETFHSANGALERDVSRQEFLESKGWTVERIWSRNWWRNPNKEINRIHQKIQELRTIKSTDLLTNELKPPQLALGELEKDPSKLQEEMLEEIIRKGESNILEFKSSIRSPSQADLAIILIEKSLEKATGQDEKHSLQRKLTDAKRTLMNALEHEVLKTIAAFMNSEGGTLLVGVNDWEM
jgi:very-short-patch-repair endonuclease